MKAGRSLQEVAGELQRQRESMRDFVADTRKLRLLPDSLDLRIGNGGGERFPVNNYAHGQVASRLGIPKKYYDRLKEEAPLLLARNVNWFFNNKPEERMIRTLDGRARAFLSDRYRPLDNIELVEAALPKIQDAGCEIKSCEVTERRLYVQAVTPRIEFEVKRGDVVQAGIVISNSEIGAGSVKVEPMVFRLACLNGMITADQSMRKYHVGGRGGNGNGDGAWEFFRDETKKLSDRAFWMQVQDTVAGALDRAKFESTIEKLRASTGNEIRMSPVKAVEELQRQMLFSEPEKDSILNHLIRGGDMSQYGLANAVTRTAEDVSDYDRAVDLEREGFEVIELPQRDWNRIAMPGEHHN